MTQKIVDIIAEYQKRINPIVGKYLQDKNMLDVGCGNGINSWLFHQNFNTSPTLLDLVDRRDSEVLAFPFVLSSVDKMIYSDKSFDVVFVQYVLHHLPQAISLDDVMRKLKKIADIVIVVEEMLTIKMQKDKAMKFDADLNDILHPNSEMPIYKYYTDEELKKCFDAAKMRLIEEKIIDEGNDDNGFLQQKIYILQ